MSVGWRVKISFVLVILLSTAIFFDKLFDFSKIICFFRPKKEDVVIVKYFPFSDRDSLREWEEKVLNKKVDYKIESEDSESYVRALSNRSCSAKYYKVKLDVNECLFLSWKWRISKFPDKQSPDNLLDKEEDDFAARVYVIFPALFFSNSKVLEYIWTKDLKVGTISSSPYSDNIKLIVVESGINTKGDWVREERNIFKDFILAFNTTPKSRIGSIAFMCDSDSTKSKAEAYFDEIKIFYRK